MNVERYLLVPYTRTGASWAGCNCWGLVYLYLREEAGLTLPLKTYRPFTDLRHRSTELAPQLDWYSVVVPKRFDIVEMWSAPNGVDWESGHVGVMVNDTQMLHTMVNAGCQCVGLDRPEIRAVLRRVWRYRRLEEGNAI